MARNPKHEEEKKSSEAVKAPGSNVRRKGIVPPGFKKKKVPLGGLPKTAAVGSGGTATGPGNFSNFLYQGGPYIHNPQVYSVFLGDWSGTAKQTRLTNLNQFLTDFLGSSYMNILSQYGVGSSGSFVQSVNIADATTSLSDGDFHTVIQNAINNNQLPEPVANSAIAFIIFLDDNMVVTDEQICEANGNFGYHNFFTTSANNPAYYAIIPGLTDSCVTTVCSAIPPGFVCSIDKSSTTQIQRQTQVASHELSEMFSDPQVGSNDAWNDNDPNTGENGDLCNGQVGTITVGTNVWNVQLMYSKWDDLITNGSNYCISSNPTPYTSLVPQFYFTVNKNTFGVDEVTDTPSYPKAFWLTLEGYSASQLGGTVPHLSGSFSTDGDLTISPNATPVVFELSGDQYTPQRITFYYDVTFHAPPFSSFPGNGSQPNTRTLHATIAMPEYTPTADTLFELVAGADPYFTNVDTTDSNAVFYLSQDLRVFTATPHNNSSPVAGAPGFGPDSAAGAYSYIQGVLTFLNNPANHFTDGTQDLFTNGTVPGQSGALDNDSNLTLVTIDNSVNPPATYNNYNFAIARVRFTGSSGSSANPVKVFFRLFITQTSDTDYQPNTTYQSNPDMSQSPPTPLSPKLGTDGGGGLVTIPFFATGDFQSTSANNEYTGGSPNDQSITIPPMTDKVWHYFGCFINLSENINGTSVFAQLPSTHNCIVAQIAYNGAPIPTNPPNGIELSPENSDKLAQRNLQITYSDNPGPAEAHFVPQTFDIRPSKPIASMPGLFLDYPDELMIDWGHTPVGSTASIYWPAVNSATVLDLANKLYTTHLLSASDGNTIQCIVSRGLTYVPIPPGFGDNFAGLFTVNLPTTVKKGQKFNIVVRRVSTHSVKTRARFNNVPVLKSGNKNSSKAAASETAVNEKVFNWRYVVGTFQVTIPVTKRDVMLRPEENTLAIMKWRLENTTKTNRWYPVLERYISYIAGRVNGLGGNSSIIPPSPLGYIPVKGKKEEYYCDAYTGKISGLIFDHFGDFEGFFLEFFDGEKKTFRSRHREMEALADRAWREAILITVGVKGKDPDEIESIIYRKIAKPLF
jgi:hypothetical protein